MLGDLEESFFSSPTTLAFSIYNRATEQKSSRLVVLLRDDDRVDAVAAILQELIQTQNTTSIELCLWRAWEQSPYSPVSSSINQRIARLRTLGALSSVEENKNVIILSSFRGWIQPTTPPRVIQNHTHLFSINDDLGNREDFRLRLLSWGYTPAELINEVGQFAFRGEILDIYIPTYSHPIRIEFFDTVVETIRFFHPETQRTLKEGSEVASVRLFPAEEVLIPHNQLAPILERAKDFCDQHQISRKIRDPIFENIRNGFLPDQIRTWFPFVYEEVTTLFDHLPPSTLFAIENREDFLKTLLQIKEEIHKEEKTYSDRHAIIPSPEILFSHVEEHAKKTLTKSKDGIPLLSSELFQSHRITIEKIRFWLEEGYSVFIGTRGLTHFERVRFFLKEILNQKNLFLLHHDSGESGVILSRKQVFLSESLLLSHSFKTEPATPSRQVSEDGTTAEVMSTQDLAVGDAVVHAVHGVGKYLGLHHLKSQERSLGEYLLIEYQGGDKLYLPIYRLNAIQRYVSGGVTPALDKLGSGGFETAKQKARDSIKKLAINLIEIYAKRALQKGAKFHTPGPDYFEFCDQFEFTETEGQVKAMNDILADFQSEKLLDRLVCGDVGFGKTEVAMRAAFQAVQSGYQAAVLVPTTLLAFQHEQSFKRRFARFPIRIESISRFKSKRQQAEILQQLAQGQIDILIGTHRLISKDVQWNKLGLLIVDEEHRFGVEHKEKIKAIQANTHTLTLTATPIPRTLNMAIAGLKDISIIKTPPTNRQPIKTYVSTYSEELVRSALDAELSRGGQAFFLYNRVQGIQNFAEDIQKLVPHAKILVAHGQMSEDEIETRMLEFYRGNAQILICTTIIESGIDVPNAGTILIHRADKLGLAQLYQIRGRVGRGHRRAHAYLLIEGERGLTQEAKMRLDTLQRFVELGSGFHIASYDLEIRGGGNFLGAEQSGHVASVGLDLFTELLEEAIAELRGKPVSLDDRHFDPEIQVPALCELSETYVSDPKIRLSFYRRLSNASSDRALEAIEDEIKDRFGPIPEEAENLFWLIRIKNLLRLTRIDALSVVRNLTSFTVRKSTLIDVDEVMKLYSGPKTHRDPRVKLTPDSKVLFEIPFTSIKSHFFELEGFLRKIAPKAFEIKKSD